MNSNLLAYRLFWRILRVVYVCAFVVGIVMILTGIWGNWRWIPTGVLISAGAAVAAVVDIITES